MPPPGRPQRVYSLRRKNPVFPPRGCSPPRGSRGFPPPRPPFRPPIVGIGPQTPGFPGTALFSPVIPPLGNTEFAPQKREFLGPKKFPQLRGPVWKKCFPRGVGKPGQPHPLSPKRIIPQRVPFAPGITRARISKRDGPTDGLDPNQNRSPPR